MFSYWIKNRSYFIVAITIALCALFCFVFVRTNFNAEAENRTNVGVYSMSEIDYDIPSPTVEQLSEIEELDFVNAAFGYYYTETSTETNGKSVETKIFFSDCMDKLDYTMYCPSRLIEKSEESYSNPIYIDYAFSKAANANIGDVVNMGDIEFQVERIYETNSYYTSAVIAPLIGKQKELILANSTAYSGAYLAVNNTSEAETYLRNYKPLGRLKSIEDFSSEEAYQKHYKSWSEADYSNEITSFSERENAVSLKSGISYGAALAIYCLVGVVANILLLMRKSETKYFSTKKEKSSIKSYFIINELITAVIGIALSVGFILLVKSSLSLYLPMDIFLSAIIWSCAAVLLTAIINAVIDLVVYKKSIISK